MFIEFIAKAQADHDDKVKKYLAQRAQRDAYHSNSSKKQLSHGHHHRQMHKPMLLEASTQMITHPIPIPKNDGLGTKSLDECWEAPQSTPPTHYRTMAWESMEDDQHQSSSIAKDASLIIEPPLSESPTLGQCFLLEGAVKDFLLDEYNVNSYRDDEENDIKMTRELYYVPDSNMTRELYSLPE